jgi:hypothetical protein
MNKWIDFAFGLGSSYLVAYTFIQHNYYWFAGQVFVTLVFLVDYAISCYKEEIKND